MSYSDEVLADSPVVYYRLGEASFPPQDSSGNGLHITTNLGSPIYSASGALIGDSNNAIQFESASNDGFVRNDDALLDVGDVFTLEAWVKRQATGVASHTIFSKSTGAFWLFWWSDDKLHLWKYGSAEVAASTVAVTDTTNWHHVVVTKNGSDRHIYLDGVDVSFLSTNLTFINNAFTLYLNCQFTNTNVGNQILDEMAIYPTALSSARVLAHYQAAGYGNTLAWLTA